MSCNKVILIGASNYNGLGLVRSFGKQGIKPYGIIVGRDAREGYLGKSKYWEEYWYVDDAEDAIPCLLKHFGNESMKPVVISYVDKVTQLLDVQYNKLSRSFILPSINHQEGEIAKLASKEEQTRIALSFGGQMLETTIVDIVADKKYETPCFYPVILKPVAGGEGDKHDITICRNESEYIKALERISDKGYTRILRQPYLENRTEYVVLGAISTENEFSSYTILKNIRQWPSQFGVGCFSEYITELSDIKVCNFVKKIISGLEKMGYDSPIDFEMFEDAQGNYYINEFNWRVSGRNFTSIDTGIDSVVWWYKIKTGQSIDKQVYINQKQGYTMKETEDIKNVLFGKIKIKKWVADLKQTSSFSLWDSADLKPVLFQYVKLIKMFLTRGQGNAREKI